MRDPNLETIGDVLYGCYANLGMAEHATYHRSVEYTQLHYIIRDRLWSGLRKGTSKPASAVKDVRSKACNATCCSSCGVTWSPTLDHVMPSSRGGRESADNILLVCKLCNSSKGGADVLESFRRRGAFPPLFMRRVYLKEAIRYCQEHGLMAQGLEGAALPLSVEAILRQFPPPGALVYFAGRPNGPHETGDKAL